MKRLIVIVLAMACMVGAVSAQNGEAVRARLEQLPEVQHVIACGVGEGGRLSDAHLF